MLAKVVFDMLDMNVVAAFCRATRVSSLAINYSQQIMLLKNIVIIQAMLGKGMNV